jgi:hypothetical protein
MATTLKQMARLSNGGALQRMTSCMRPADYAMMVGGGGLVLYGVARRTLVGLGIAAMGAALVGYSACRDHDDEQDKVRKQVSRAPKRYCEVNAGDIEENRQTPRDDVDEASMESVPGSDPPAVHRAAVA